MPIAYAIRQGMARAIRRRNTGRVDGIPLHPYNGFVDTHLRLVGAPPRPPGIRAVLFDLDGTLVSTHIDFGAMRRDVLAVIGAAGVPATVVEGLDILGMVARAAAWVRQAAGEAAAADLVRQAEEAMVAVELRGLEGARAAPFARDVLHALAEGGVGVAIVTRNCRRATDAVLRMSQLACPVVLTREDVARYKPDPAHLHDALARLGVPPSAAVMVGDHTMDVEAGRAAGTRTVGVLLPERPPDYFAAVAPDLVISDLRDLLPFVLGAP